MNPNDEQPYHSQRISPEEYEKQKQETTARELAKLHKQLAENKNAFMMRVPESSSDSDSEEEIRMRLPRKKRNDPMVVLHEVLAKQEKITKLKLQNKESEVRLRYTVLDLSNTQAELEKVREELKTMKKENKDLKNEIFWKKIYMWGETAGYLGLSSLYFAFSWGLLGW
jgi:ABC-type Zn uptake system ZnuABC Zn-binding protein ZnuA